MSTPHKKPHTQFGEKLYEYMNQAGKPTLSQQDLCWKVDKVTEGWLGKDTLAPILNRAILHKDKYISRAYLIRVVDALIKDGRIETLDQANELLRLQNHLPLGDIANVDQFERKIMGILAVSKKDQRISGSSMIVLNQTTHTLPPNYDFEELQARDYVFWGREDYLEKLRPYLDRETDFKLLTIWGTFGEGKTALTEAALEMHEASWENGIVAISLEKTKSKEKLTKDLAQFLDLPFQNKENQTKSSERLGKEVLAVLKEKRVLIVFDNFETLLWAIQSTSQAEKADAQALMDYIWYGLLSTQASLLVTSRELTCLPGEISIFLDGLNEKKGAELFLKCTTRPIDVAKEEIEVLSKRIGGHPLSLRLLGRAYSKSLSSFQDFLKEWEKCLFEAEDIYKKEDNRNRSIYASIYHSIRYLDSDLRRWLSSLSIFQGPFKPETAIQIITQLESHKDTHIVSQGISELVSRGLLLEKNGPVQLLSVQTVLYLYLKKYLHPDIKSDSLEKAFCSVHQNLVVEVEKKINDEKTIFFARQAEANFESVESMGRLVEVERGMYRKSWAYILYQLNQYDKSLEWFEKALEDLKGKDNDLESFINYHLGNITLTMGRLNTAENYYLDAIKIQTILGDRVQEATLHQNIGRVYRDNRMFDKALESFNRALSIFNEIGDSLGKAVILNNKGRLFQSKSRLREALSCFQDALVANLAANDRAVNTYALWKIGEVYQEQGRISDALVQFEEVLAIYLQLSPREWAAEAITLNSIAKVYKERGEFDLARQYYEKSLRIRREIPDRSGEADVYNNLGRVEQASGNFKEALALYQKALSIYREVGNREGEAIAQRNIGQTYKDQSDFETCLEYFEYSLAIYKGIGDRAGQATVYNNLGMAYLDHGVNDKALLHFDSAYMISKEDGHCGIQTDSIQNIAMAQIGLGCYKDVQMELENLVQIAQSNALLSIQCGGLVLSARLLFLQSSYCEQATRCMELALKIFSEYNLYRDSLGNRLPDLNRIWNEMHAG